MKNILYVSPFARIGGGELSLIAILKNLDKEAFKALVICYEEGHFPDKLRELGFDCVVLKRRFKALDGFLILRLISYIKKRKIDIVHVNSLDIRAAIAAKLSGAALIGHLRVIFAFTWVDSLFARLSDITIAVSYAALEAFCAKFKDLRDKFIVLAPLIDMKPGETAPADLRKEFNLNEQDKLIGIVGRLDPFKGHDVFLRSAAIVKNILPRVKFFIIGGSLPPDNGEAAYLKQIKELARELGLSGDVIFTGFRDDVLKVIAGLDVLVAPSRQIKRGSGVVNEGFGRIILEAMSLGVPVVASASGGLREIIDDKVHGLLVRPDDYARTAEAVLFILNNAQKRQEMLEAAKRKFESCYSVKNISLLLKLYHNVIREKRRGIE